VFNHGINRLKQNTPKSTRFCWS